MDPFSQECYQHLFPLKIGPSIAVTNFYHSNSPATKTTMGGFCRSLKEESGYGYGYGESVVTLSDTGTQYAI